MKQCHGSCLFDAQCCQGWCNGDIRAIKGNFTKTEIDKKVGYVGGQYGEQFAIGTLLRSGSQEDAGTTFTVPRGVDSSVRRSINVIFQVVKIGGLGNFYCIQSSRRVVVLDRSVGEGIESNC